MSYARTLAAPAPTADRRLLSNWLFLVAALVVAMVFIGGLTRLTESGLSMVEWKPVTGWLPPLGEAAWQAEFDKYRQFPEYQKINRGMSLAEFKGIFWLEYWHRVLGRVLGLVFAVPLAVFLILRKIERPYIAPLVAALFLGGLQGAVGWFMVQSGLVDRPAVSHYRLAMHLGLALLLYVYLLHLALDLRGVARAPSGGRLWPRLVLLLVFGQILLGAFVAGLDAGFVYNTWPLMDGALVPSHLFTDPVARVQFEHRMGAYVVTLAVLALWWRDRHVAGSVLLPLFLVLQMVIGIATLLAVTPIWLASLHQLGAVALLTATYLHVRRVGAL